MNSLGRGSRIALLLGLILWGVPSPRAKAVMVSTTTGNLTAPGDDFGFANVGVKGTATGVYLGYRWVLTATHAGASSIVLNGQTYAYETGTSVQLLNPTGQGLSTYTDLTLFRIDRDPWLPSLTIAETPLSPWDEVVMMGYGQNRADTPKAWDITGDYSGGTWVWTETDPPGDAQGYLMFGSKSLRWGTNRVEPGMYAIDLGGTDILAFSTDFDQFGATDYEAQASPGDSGGGVFHKNGDQWELVGLMHAVSDLPNQPSYAIFGVETYSTDLSVYRDQILDIITPLGGDANLDGTVDSADAAIMAAHWGLTGALWGNGDFNEDGTIDNLDAAILADHWGETLASGAAEAAGEGAIPEPSMLALILAGLVGLVVRRARQSQ